MVMASAGVGMIRAYMDRASYSAVVQARPGQRPDRHADICSASSQ